MSTSDILESLIEKDNGYLITSKAVESGDLASHSW